MSGPINPLKQLAREGQSVWYDNIHRSMIASGQLGTMIDEDGLAGITSNPAIFDKAISTGSAYDEGIRAVLSERGAARLQGRAAIANAKVAHELYGDVFGPGFEALQRHGARPQRLLWASTGTMNPDYDDVKYVEAVIGQNTVNTMPPATFEAFRDHGRVASTLSIGTEEARRALKELAACGIDLDALTQRLEQEGVAAFASLFENLLQTLAAKSAALAA